MSAYEKPMIHVVPEQAEGIFMASGDKTVCLLWQNGSKSRR